MIVAVGATMDRPPVARRIGAGAITTVAIAAAYLVAARLGLTFALVNEQVTPVWAPAGIAVAALVLLGSRALPGIALGAFAVNAPLGPSLATALLITAGNTAAPAAVAGALRIVGFDPRLRQSRDAVTLVVASTGGMLLSATVGALALAHAGAVAAEGFWTTWSVWWSGDATGALVVTPAILLAASARWPARIDPRRVAEAGVILVSLVIVTTLVFRTDLPIRFAPFPLLVWAALRFEQTGAAAATLAASMSAAITIAMPGSFDTSVFARVFALQLFSATAALMTLLLGVTMADRRRARLSLVGSATALEERVQERTGELTHALRQLEESQARLAEAQQVARIGSWLWEIETNHITWSEELYRITGLDPDASITYETYLSTVHPDDRAAVAATIQRAYADHARFSFEHRTVRPDGTMSWVYCEGRVVTGGHGRAVRMMGICQDIEDRKRAETVSATAHAAESRRRQALELNDEVVQGLSIAVYAMDAGDLARARGALEATLLAARSIVGGLLAGDGTLELSPGGLTREVPADIFRRAI